MPGMYSHDYLDGPWEQVRGNLVDELQQLQVALRNILGAIVNKNLTINTGALDDIPLSALADIDAGTLIGRRSTTDGAPEEITLGPNLSLVGTVLDSTASGSSGANTIIVLEEGGGEGEQGPPGGPGATGPAGAAGTPGSAGSPSNAIGQPGSDGEDGESIIMNLPKPVTRTITFVFDGGSSTIAANSKVYLQVPFSCEIQSWTILSSDAAVTSGSIVFDIWKDTLANYPPTVGDTITAAAKPTLTSATSASSSGALTGWTTSINAGDILGVNVDSVTSLIRATLELTVIGA